MTLQGAFVSITKIVAGCLVGRWAGRYLSASKGQTLMTGFGLAELQSSAYFGLDLETSAESTSSWLQTINCPPFTSITCPVT